MSWRATCIEISSMRFHVIALKESQCNVMEMRCHSCATAVLQLCYSDVRCDCAKGLISTQEGQRTGLMLCYSWRYRSDSGLFGRVAPGALLLVLFVQRSACRYYPFFATPPSPPSSPPPSNQHGIVFSVDLRSHPLPDQEHRSSLVSFLDFMVN
jgi:hypothetical protein